jgi:hypothetical protein
MSRKRAGQRIAELRERGYTIKVRQLRMGTVGFAPFGEFRMDEIRERRQKDNNRLQVHPRGGRTEVILTTPDGVTVEGEARCRVDDYTKGGKWREGDMFNKNIGLTIALNRALHELGKQDNEALVKAMSNNGGWSIRQEEKVS